MKKLIVFIPCLTSRFRPLDLTHSSILYNKQINYFPGKRNKKWIQEICVKEKRAKSRTELPLFMTWIHYQIFTRSSDQKQIQKKINQNQILYIFLIIWFISLKNVDRREKCGSYDIWLKPNLKRKSKDTKKTDVLLFTTEKCTHFCCRL